MDALPAESFVESGVAVRFRGPVFEDCRLRRVEELGEVEVGFCALGEGFEWGIGMVEEMGERALG